MAAISQAAPLIRRFMQQSYFSDTHLQNAIRRAPPGQQIVDVQEANTRGYALGLHPNSETPVAVEFKGVGANASASGVMMLKPGQIIRLGSAGFSGFKWGLPFGWLGGGVAQLIVFTSQDVDVVWDDSPEVIFHRQRMKILAPAAAAWAAVATPGSASNWPVRFPWTNAYHLSSSAPQQGQPVFAVKPTRVMMRVRKAGYNDADRKFRAHIRGFDLFDIDSSGDNESRGADVTVQDVIVPFSAIVSGLPVGFATDGYSVIELTDGPLARLGGDGCEVVLVANTLNETTLDNVFVDVIRFGQL